MSTSTYQANKLLNYNFGATAYTLVPNYYVGLSTTTISADGTGITEPTAMGYARVLVPNTTVYFSNSTAASLSNLGMIRFPKATGNWGTITYVFMSDAASGGNMLYYQALTTPKAITTNTVGLFVGTAFEIGIT